jgi:hypothetical protein
MAHLVVAAFVGGYVVGDNQATTEGVSTVGEISKACKKVVETARRLSAADQRYLHSEIDSPEEEAAFQDLNAESIALVQQLKSCPP